MYNDKHSFLILEARFLGSPVSQTENFDGYSKLQRGSFQVTVLKKGIQCFKVN